MKKYIFLTIVIFSFLFSNAQEWSCESISQSITEYNTAHNKDKKNKKFASVLMDMFPLNTDGQVEFNYVLVAKDSIPRNEIVALTEGWLGTVFTNANQLIEVSDEDHIVCKGQWGQVAIGQKFIGATMIMAPVEIKVLYKENRVKLTVLTRNYRMAYANVGVMESGVVNINSVYPFNSKSEHKDEYAEAFINVISKSLNLSAGYLNYLNKHTNDSKSETDNDW